MNKKFRDLDEMSSYIIKEMFDKDNVSCIILYEILDDVYYPLQEQLNLISCYRETSSEYDSYVITKKLVAGDKFILYTEPLLFDDGCLVNDISNDIIILVEGILSEDDIDELNEKEEIIFVDLEYSTKECNCEQCQGNCDKETTIQKQESEYDQLGNEDKEYIDLLVDEILDNILCPDCLKEQLAAVFNEGFEVGKNTALLAVSDSLRDLIS